ncbi:hypothetical protein LTR36_000309 [Oleoguttula mirabilis]|uniref:UBA domain-containing protein n=1 Tax=Oleoguttula mirabilis TaxID=1507867 RepID=A0AAV9JYP2_9PEZI|nr:hypothetical protein LTR36_000309 [Oleoguttula mirabilis]
MAEAQFASLDGAALFGTETLCYAPNPNAMARRSISIFSRRGTETPEPTPPFIAQAAMKTSKQMTERQKSWIGRRRSACGGSSLKATEPPKPKGTVLNAVPPTRTIKMTPLEEEMARSPNDEIMSAVSVQPSTLVPWTAHSPKLSPTQQTSFWNKSTTSSAQRTKSVQRRETQSRIGLWVNGVAQWDDEAHQYRATLEEPSIEEETVFTPVRSAAIITQERPSLSVTIPRNAPIVDDMSLSTLDQPRPWRHAVSVAPAGIVSRFSTAPTITVEEVADGSLLAFTRIEPLLERSNGPSKLVSTESQEHSEVSQSSSSCSSLADHDDGSVSSNRSSATSVEAVPILTKRSSKRLSGRISSSVVAIPTPSSVDKPLPPNPIPVPRRAPPARPSLLASDDSQGKLQQSRSAKSASDGSEGTRPVQPRMSTRSLSQLDLLDQEFTRSSPYASNVPESTTPTLSQAEHELQAHLSALAEGQAPIGDVGIKQREHVGVTVYGLIKRNDSVRTVMHPPERAPTVPKRSRKREWRASTADRLVVQLAAVQAPARRRSAPGARLQAGAASDSTSLVDSGVRRSLSASEIARAKAMHAHDFVRLLPVPDEKIVYTPMLSTPLPLPRIFIDDGLIVVHGPVVMGENGGEVPATAVAAASAEEVLLRILSALTTTEDLCSTAMTNKGMFRIYKENEMQLLRTVAFNQSPAAWEFREWCPPERRETVSSKASSQLEHSPNTYTRCHQRDVAVIESLKTLILEQCQTFIRRETVLALSTPSHPHAQRFNDAFWRIWCFCKIFGCGKNREDDVTGQLDWLKGGLLANNQGCAATVDTNLDFDMSSVLLNAPDFFAKGNANGLSAQQLYDMTEIWTCLSALLQGYQGRADQADEAGIFEGCGVSEGDVEREEQMLEEWTFHLLTLGPTVVLEMADLAADRSSAGFSLAKINGWTDWSPPQYNGSRGTFLKEPVARLYEERVAAAALSLQNPRLQEKKETSRKHLAHMAAEIRLRRQTSSYRRSPYIDMSMERPMSVRRHTSTTSTCSSQPVVSPMSATGRKTIPSPSTPSAPNFPTPNPLSPGAWSPRKISPIIEERVESFNRMSLLNFAEGVAEDTSTRAVSKIVDMGFSIAQARFALRTTDMGDGLRVDRAVDLLLRQ